MRRRKHEKFGAARYKQESSFWKKLEEKSEEGVMGESE